MTVYTIEQAATKLGRTTRTIRRWIDEGLLTATRAKDLGIAVGNPEKLFLKEEDVEELAKEPTTPHSQPHIHDMTMTSPDTMSTELQQLEQKAKLSLMLPDTVTALLHKLDSLAAKVAQIERVDLVALLERLERVEREIAGTVRISNVELVDTLTERVECLEHEREVSGKYLATVAVQLAEMTKRMEQLEQLASQRATMAVETPVVEVTPTTDERKMATTATTDATETPKKAGRPVGVKAKIEPPVPGAILARDFAERHGVNPRTFADHIIKGMRGERVEAIERPKPGRAHETERWLTHEQQEQALAFWKRHNVKYTMSEHELPEGYIPLTSFLDQHGINRNAGRHAIKLGFVHAEGEALSPVGQREVYTQFHKDDGFRTCDQCPHTVTQQ